MNNFALSDRTLPLDVHVHPRAKRLILRLERGGRALRVTVPTGTPEQQIANFLAKNQSWIEDRLKKIPPTLVDGPMIRVGVYIPYLGQPHQIIHQRGRGITTLITTPQGDRQICVSGEAAHLPRRLAVFFQKQARSTISPLVASYATRLDSRVKSIQFKDTKSRWGSCSATGRLSFSWRIIMAPLPVVHYLVAHEVAHLVEMNHGQHFWQICTDLCPQTQTCRDWLKRNGQALQAIDFG